MSFLDEVKSKDAIPLFLFFLLAGLWVCLTNSKICCHFVDAFVDGHGSFCCIFLPVARSIVLSSSNKSYCVPCNFSLINHICTSTIIFFFEAPMLYRSNWGYSIHGFFCSDLATSCHIDSSIFVPFIFTSNYLYSMFLADTWDVVADRTKHMRLLVGLPRYHLFSATFSAIIYERGHL